MTTTTVFKIGTAHRLEDGRVKYSTSYNGREFANRSRCTMRIMRLFRDYARANGKPLPPDEFVVIETTTTVHDPIKQKSAKKMTGLELLKHVP